VIFVLVGALGGNWASALIGRRTIVWYNQPGEGTALCHCQALANSVTGDLLHWQLIGLLVGAALALILYFVQWRLFAKRARGQGQPPSQTVAHA
jgi:hypothetical protein